MKKVLLTLTTIFICLFGALAQSSTTLTVQLYPIQTIELNSIVNEDVNFNTFSTSKFSVNILKKGTTEYDFSMKDRIKAKPDSTYYNNQPQLINRAYRDPHIVYSMEVL